MNSSGKLTLPDGLRTLAEKIKQKVTKPRREALYHGLINQGATCYLNSVLQVLFMTTEIHDRLDPEAQITDQELKILFNKLKEKTCGTENITKTLEIENVNQQCDAAECLELILNKVSQQASEVFQGQLTYTIKCFKGHIINEETNPFWTIPLPLKDTQDSAYSMESSFKRIFQTKTYTGDNMVYCNDCNDQTDATSGCEMVEAPQILVLLLKRFDFDYNTRSHFKSDCCVEVPCELQLKNKMYKLYGMVNHMGSIRGGHYTATVLSDEYKCWYEFDDTRVKKVEEPFAETGPFKSRTVYLLIYRAAESQTSPETNKLDDLRRDDVEPKRSLAERDADDGNEGQIRQKDTDEVEETSDEALNSQTGGEEGAAETGKNNPVRSETEPERESSNREKVENSVDVKEQDNLDVNVGEQSEDSSEQHLDEETKTEEEEQRVTECQKPVGPEGLKGDEEPKISFCERNADDEETTPMGHSVEDEGLMTKDRKEERLQAQREESDEENVESDTSINDHTTVSKVKSSADEDAQENEDSNTPENSNSEELNVTRVEDASVNVVEQPKDSCEQHLDGTKVKQRARDCQKSVETTSEDVTDEVKEEQSEYKLKGDEVEHKRKTGELYTGDEETE